MTIDSTLETMTRAVDHMTACEFKNSKAAALQETPASSEQYLTLHRAMSTEEAVPEAVYSRFTETNSYYFNFLVKAGLCDKTGEILSAPARYVGQAYALRTAPDYSLMSQPSGILSETELKVFTSLWQESVDHYWKHVHSKALEYYPKPEVLAMVCIIARTLIRFVNINLLDDNIENLGAMTDIQIMNYILSWDLDLVADVTRSQRLAIAKSLIYLVTNKGSQLAINRIMEVLDYDDVDLYWYLLVFGGNYGMAFDSEGLPTDVPFVRTPYFIEIPYQENTDDYLLKHEDQLELIPYTEIIADDPYWKATEEEMLSLPLQTMRTKYLGARSTLYSDNMEIYGMLYWWLEKFRIDENFLGASEMAVTNSTYSATPFFIADFFIGIAILRRRLFGMQDINPVDPDLLATMYTENNPPHGYWNPKAMDIPKVGIPRKPGINDIWKRSDFNEVPTASSVLTAFVENNTFLADCVARLETIPEYNVEYRYMRRFEFIKNITIGTPVYPTQGGSTGLEDYLQLVNPQLHQYLGAVTTEDGIANMIFTLKGEIMTWINQHSPSPLVCFPTELKKRMPAIGLLQQCLSHTDHFLGVDQRIVGNNRIMLMDFGVFKYNIYPEDHIGYIQDDTRWIQMFDGGDTHHIGLFETSIFAKTLRTDWYLFLEEVCGIQYDVFDRNNLKLIDSIAMISTLPATTTALLMDSCFVWRPHTASTNMVVGDYALLKPTESTINNTVTELDTWLDPDDSWLEMDDPDAWFTGDDATY